MEKVRDEDPANELSWVSLRSRREAQGRALGEGGAVSSPSRSEVAASMGGARPGSEYGDVEFCLSYSHLPGLEVRTQAMHPECKLATISYTNPFVSKASDFTEVLDSGYHIPLSSGIRPY